MTNSYFSLATGDGKSVARWPCLRCLGFVCVSHYQGPSFITLGITQEMREKEGCGRLDGQVSHMSVYRGRSSSLHVTLHQIHDPELVLLYCFRVGSLQQKI